MNPLTKSFIWLIGSLFGLVFFLIFLSMMLSSPAQAQPASNNFPVPVSTNALMVTLIDHSAHYIWDYAALEDEISEGEWQAVEYYAVQLAAAGPLITLGGTGQYDDAWAATPRWVEYSRLMSSAAGKALNAAHLQDQILLEDAGNDLLDSCLGCHDDFKLDIPSEGMFHDPQYDHLYHLFERQE